LALLAALFPQHLDHLPKKRLAPQKKRLGQLLLLLL
jgi:hypothetical protein